MPHVEVLLSDTKLLDADGGQWKARAIRSIGDYLRSVLPKGTTVLA